MESKPIHKVGQTERSDVRQNQLMIPSALQQLYTNLDIAPTNKPITVSNFTDNLTLAESTLGDRMAASLQVLLDCVAADSGRVEKVDRVLLDHYITKIDQILNKQIDSILHHPEFQSLESSWRGLHYLVDRTDFRANTTVELLDISKEDLRSDFAAATETTQTGLFTQIYTHEYDIPGGEPISVMIADYEFDSSANDLNLLQKISKVAAVTHCPFIAAVGAEFFHKMDFDAVMRIDDLNNYLQRAEYIRWNAFRESDDARFIGLTLPRFLLRLPYGLDNPVPTFNYKERVAGQTADKYLWGNACFAFAANISRSFKNHGWAINIRGPEAGGKVKGLPLHHYDYGRGLQTKIPTEILIPETRELELAQHGFIPLSYYKNSDFACFFSANSINKPALYVDDAATANARINARLPYIFLSSRLGHYLKVFQRENIGSNKSRTELEQELNQWLQTLVTKMNNPGPELAATHPLREAYVTVELAPDNPGFYKVKLYALPHFQIEGVDVHLAVVAQLPGKEKGVKEAN